MEETPAPAAEPVKVTTESPAAAVLAENPPAAPRQARPPATPVEIAWPPTNPQHSMALLALTRSREDAVDACRDRVKLPPVMQLLPWAMPLARATDSERHEEEEISMEQVLLFEITASKSGYRISWAKVVETWLVFPDASRRSLLRAPFNDEALDRCVEEALRGAVARVEGVKPGETFRIQGHAGEAVFDLR